MTDKTLDECETCPTCKGPSTSKEPCPACDGREYLNFDMPYLSCGSCGGSGKKHRSTHDELMDAQKERADDHYTTVVIDELGAVYADTDPVLRAAQEVDDADMEVRRISEADVLDTSAVEKAERDLCNAIVSLRRRRGSSARCRELRERDDNER